MNQETQGSSVQIFYDGSCPVCSREISFYKSLRGADEILWTDLCEQVELPDSIDRDSALRRIHAIDVSGDVVSGVQVFPLIWSTLPRLKLLGVAARLPAVSWVLDALYWLFLNLRPASRSVQHATSQSV